MNPLFRNAAIGSLALLLIGAAPTSQPTMKEIFQQQVQMAQQQLERAEKERAAAMDKTEATRQEIRSATGRADVSPEGLRQAITKLQEQQETLLLDEAGAGGRRQGLSEAIAKLTQQVKNKADTDAAVDELTQVVALREKELQRMQQLDATHTIPQQTLEDAQAKVADARLKLIEARRQTIGNANAESLEMWNRELMSLSVAEVERRARLKFIQERLNRLSAVVPKIDELERSIGEEQRAERTLQTAQSRYNDARQRQDWQATLPGSTP